MQMRDTYIYVSLYYLLMKRESRESRDLHRKNNDNPSQAVDKNGGN